MDLEIIRCVKSQLLNLVGQSIAYDGFNDPIVYFSIGIGVIVNYVACVTKTEELVSYEGMSPSSEKKSRFQVVVLQSLLLKTQVLNYCH